MTSSNADLDDYTRRRQFSFVHPYTGETIYSRLSAAWAELPTESMDSWHIIGVYVHCSSDSSDSSGGFQHRLDRAAHKEHTALQPAHCRHLCQVRCLDVEAEASMLTELVKTMQQRLEQLLAVDHICSNDGVRHLPFLGQLRDRSDAPTQLLSSS